MKVLRLLPRFRQAYRAMDELAAREQWNRSAIEAYQLDRLNRLWFEAIHYVPHYRELFSAGNLPREFQSLDEFRRRVPCLSKQSVRDDAGAFLSERSEPGDWRRTGGSTGEPTRIFIGRGAHLAMLRAKYRFYASWGLDIFDRFAFLWGHGASFAPGWAGRSARLRQPVVDRMRNRRRLSAYHLGRDDLRRHLNEIDRFRPAAIYGYASAVYLLAREAIDTGFQCDSLRACILTAEPTYPHMVDTVGLAFSAPVINQYGATECELIAGEDRDGMLRVREDMVLLETLPRPDGGYDIACTELNNSSFPLIRRCVACPG
jgi:phenylacetate-CoA ligase